MNPPPVPLDQVEWRVDGKPADSAQGESTARFVPYVNAPIVARLLDEWVTPFGWRDEYEPAQVNGHEALWCHLSVKTGDEWVTKTDIGVPSNFEGEKGMVSDAFKRAACLKWGVARNVYELPTLWAPCRVDRKGNAWPNDKTIPEILRKLKAQGIEASGGTAAAHHVEEPTTAPAWVADAAARLDLLPPFFHGRFLAKLQRDADVSSLDDLPDTEAWQQWVERTLSKAEEAAKVSAVDASPASAADDYTNSIAPFDESVPS